jgi:hypothetical protein
VRCIVKRRANLPADGILKLTPMNNGYLCVSLSQDGRRSAKLLHRLICTAFHGPCPSWRHQAAHGDGVRSNNVPSNLRWATPEQNCADRKNHGTHFQGSQLPWAVLTEDQIPIIRRLLEEHVPGAVIARAFNVSPSTISLINVGKNWKHVTAGVDQRTSTARIQ